MSASRFSQVIIPPPASAASLQFASFSSIGFPSRSSAPSVTKNAAEGSSSWATGTGDSSLMKEKRSNNSGGINNIRNLSIQIVEADRSSRNSSRASRRTLEYEGEPTSVHPLDEDLAAVSSASTTPATTGGAVTREDGLIRTHQTMNRVHPNLDQDFVDSPGGSEGSSSLGSRVGSINGGGSGTFLGPHDRRASDNAHQKQHEGGFSYFDRTSPGSFRPRSLSATNLDSVGTNNGSTPSLHQQLSWADREAMQREGSSHSRSFDTGTPPISGSSFLSPHLHPSNGGGGELSDVVMVKKSAKGRMFTVERQTTLPPASPTRSSRFIVVSSTEDMCLSSPSPLSPHHALH
ncbi:hypothetical protein BGZ47_009620 [Haplosporangium gracile]|nr:hypothetical protein BGZ47_009620 [Haplosporangium gracile]